MSRILGTQVPALFPASGPVRLFLMGEAPGPRGADQSGLPFWGDRAGVQVYRALVKAGLAEVPEAAWEDWDGARFKALGIAPHLKGAVLGNAFPSCPTKDGQTFRAPTDKELKDPANLARLGKELGRAAARCHGTLRVIGMGRRAQWILERLEGLPPVEVHVLPHPSAQGLLQAAPDKGRGMRLAELQAAWEHRLESLLAE
jgi:hypothetical protein